MFSLYYLEVPEKENQSVETEVILRRTQSFESDEKYVLIFIDLIHIYFYFTSIHMHTQNSTRKLNVNIFMCLFHYKSSI